MNSFLRRGVFVGAVFASMWLLPVGAIAQAPAKPANDAGKGKEAGPLPRTADGHPDLNGVWGGGAGGGDDDSEVLTINLAARSVDGTGKSNPTIFNDDNAVTRRMDTNRPLYKPEYWATVQKMDQTGNTADPTFNCLPAGVPRVGPPRKIVETPTEIIFFYQNPDTYRVIAMDGRAHSPKEKLEGTWNGEAIGRWDGDTLVVDTIGFNDESWLDITGYVHSENLHVVERLHRNDNAITWQATVDDPDALLKPWMMNPRTIKLDPNPKATLDESLPCIENDASHLVTGEHH